MNNEIDKEQLHLRQNKSHDLYGRRGGLQESVLAPLAYDVVEKVEIYRNKEIV